MLILNSNIINKNVMSLQTGTVLAKIIKSVVDPSDLKIAAFYLEDRFEKKAQNFLMTKDIRELSPIGAIVDSSDEFVTKEDVISLEKIIQINIELVGMQVIDENKRKIGKVTDYAINSKDFFIWQLHVGHGFVKSISSVSSIISRNQIIEITDSQIVVKSPEEKIKSKDKSANQVFINPFATSSSPESTEA